MILWLPIFMYMGWINRIADGIEKAFSVVRKPLATLPPLLLICETYQRPGLSAIALTAAIIQRMPEAKIETGVNNCGAPNKNNKFIRIVCEELIKEIKDNARVTCVVETSKLNSIGTGGGAVVSSVNTFPTNTDGIVQ